MEVEKVIQFATKRMERLVDNLTSCFPTDWRSYTVRERDDEKVVSEICEGPKMSRITPRINLLKGAVKLVKETYSDLGVPWAEASIDERIGDAIEEAKLLVGVRALSTVTLQKLPTESRPKSKAALMREAKRLVKMLEVDIPTSIVTLLEQAAL